MRNVRRFRSSSRGLACVLLAAVSGCTIIHTAHGRPIDSAQVDFEEGETHYRDVLRELGPPTKVGALPDGSTFVYEHLTTRERQFGLNLPGDILEWIKFSVGKTKGDLHSLMLVFDRSGRLRGQSFAEREVDLGSGGSIQLIVSVASIVDTSAVESDAAPNDWGMRLLRDLPATLNSRNSLETGENGVQLRGAPDKAGQNSLEMR